MFPESINIFGNRMGNMMGNTFGNIIGNIMAAGMGVVWATHLPRLAASTWPQVLMLGLQRLPSSDYFSVEIVNAPSLLSCS